jgi:Papain family cysteine protease
LEINKVRKFDAVIFSFSKAKIFSIAELRSKFLTQLKGKRTSQMRRLLFSKALNSNTKRIMKIRQFLVCLFAFLVEQPFISAQVDTLPFTEINVKGLNFGISKQELIDKLMPVLPGLGSNSRQMLTEQSVKPYLMPPRKLAGRGTAGSYAIATCLEFYVNFDNNYKVNLSPDYISLNVSKKGPSNLKNAFQFLAVTGTVSAAIMPYGASTIPAAVYATEKYKVLNYLQLFREDLKTRQKVFETKKALMRGNPVLIEMKIPANFKDLKDTKYWTPVNPKTVSTHPFIVVGFDQDLKSFEILSSWGNDWGNNGYLWVKFDDFGKYALNGYVIVPN